MQIMYVDESGDPGLSTHSSKFFILSGLILSSEDWNESFQKLKLFRKHLKTTYGLNMRIELHASELIRPDKTIEHKKIPRKERMAILKDFAAHIPVIFNRSKIINVCLEKNLLSSSDVSILAWSRLIQRYDTYLKKMAKDNGIIIADEPQNAKLVGLMRKMRVYNPLPSQYSNSTYDAPVDNIIEDMFFRSSKDSYFIQAADSIVHLLYRQEVPKGSLKKHGIHLLFKRLNSLLLLEASKKDKQGIVRN